MDDVLIWLKFSNPDDIYLLDSEKDNLQCPRCKEFLFVRFWYSDLENWTIDVPAGTIERKWISWHLDAPFVTFNIPGDSPTLTHHQDGKRIILKECTFSRPDDHTCKESL